MDRRHSLAALIGEHFASFRKSRRKTLTALVFGLLMGRRLGLATIARRVAGAGFRPGRPSSQTQPAGRTPRDPRLRQPMGPDADLLGPPGEHPPLAELL